MATPPPAVATPVASSDLGAPAPTKPHFSEESNMLRANR